MIADLGLANLKVKRPKATMGEFLVLIFQEDDDAVHAKDHAVRMIDERHQ